MIDMHKKSQRQYKIPEQKAPQQSDPSPSFSWRDAIGGFISGFQNDWSGAGLSPEELYMLRQTPRANWLQKSFLPPQLRKKVQRYLGIEHDPYDSIMYRMERDRSRAERDRATQSRPRKE